MLVPIHLGLCRAADLDRGHVAAGALINASLGMAVVVSPRPLCRDDRSRRLLGVASLPLPGSQVRAAKLVQPGFNLGRQSRLGRCSIACDQPGERVLSRIIKGIAHAIDGGATADG
jgi:hypothetical protein